METSDSEYFESADEDFDGDGLILSKPTVTSQSASSQIRSKVIPVVSAESSKSDTQSTGRKQVNIKPSNSKLGKKIRFNDGNISNDAVENFDSSASKELEDMHIESTLKSDDKFSSLLPRDSGQEGGSWDWDEDVIDDKKEAKVSSCLKSTSKLKSSRSETTAQKEKGCEEDEGEKTKPKQSSSLTPKESVQEENTWGWEKDEGEKTKPKQSSSLPPKESVQEENAWGWEEDDWEAINKSSESETKKLVSEETKWSGWGNWGVSSLLSTATVGLSTVTSHVSHVLENGMGVPDPEELARLHKSEIGDKTDKPLQQEKSSSQSGFGLGSFVSGVNQITKLVETTSSKVISGGLDTLETIGKKTMEVLQEGDPGLKKKRAFLHIKSDKPILSQILREAKEKVETENKILTENHFSKKANYESLFDDHQGLVHLEALEMLSRQCDIKLQTILESLFGKELTEMQETLEQIKELCELPDEDEERVLSSEELEESLNNAVIEMNIPLTFNKLIASWIESEQWLDAIKLGIVNELELHEQSINILAQLTATAVENFHKIGELLLVKSHRSTVDEADSLVQLTILLTTLISQVAKKLCDKLNEKGLHSGSDEKTSELITNVYYEAANSSTYIQNSFQLLLPILQVGVL